MSSVLPKRKQLSQRDDITFCAEKFTSSKFLLNLFVESCALCLWSRKAPSAQRATVFVASLPSTIYIHNTAKTMVSVPTRFYCFDFAASVT